MSIVYFRKGHSAFWRHAMLRLVGYLLVFVAGWLVSSVFEVDTAVEMVGQWARSGWLGPWYALVAG